MFVLTSIKSHCFRDSGKNKDYGGGKKITLSIVFNHALNTNYQLGSRQRATRLCPSGCPLFDQQPEVVVSGNPLFKWKTPWWVRRLNDQFSTMIHCLLARYLFMSK